MTRARDMANIAAGSFSIPSGSLTNATPAAGSITNSMLASNAITSANLPSGTVLQVVEGRSAATDFRPTALDTYQDIGLSVTITPSSNSSKIFVTFTTGIVANNVEYLITKLLRNSTAIHYTNQYYNGAHWQGANGASVILDSPATTSAVTYKVQGFQDSGSINAAIWDYNGAVSSIVAMEIAG